MKIVEGNRMNRLVGMILAILVFIAMMPFNTLKVNAEAYTGRVIGDYKYDIYNDGTSSNPYGSIHIVKYNGYATQVILPSQVTYNGMTFNAWDSKHNTQGNGAFAIGDAAFSGNTKITKIAIPQGYESLGVGVFKGCTSLTEVAIGDSLRNMGYSENEGAFTGCLATTYYFKGENISQSTVEKSGIGTDASGNPIAGVTVWTKQGSNVDKAIQELNKTRDSDKKITLKYDNDPYSKNTVTPDSGGGGTSGGGSTPSNNNGSAAAIEKTILANTNDKDVKGSTFALLQARAKKVAKNSVTLGWTKPKGAKSYVVYGNMCNTGKKKYKYVKLTTTTKNTITFKTIKKTKIKKGTYYKFIVVALDANGNVVATSKSIHAATTGGKVGNDKAVNTAAKKNKVTVKRGKSFKLKAKAVAASSKLKVKKHRNVAYESSNPAVATVSAKGVIKGKKKGTCFVYAYAQNGVFRKIKVTVK